MWNTGEQVEYLNIYINILAYLTNKACQKNNKQVNKTALRPQFNLKDLLFQTLQYYLDLIFLIFIFIFPQGEIICAAGVQHQQQHPQ